MSRKPEADAPEEEGLLQERALSQEVTRIERAHHARTREKIWEKWLRKEPKSFVLSPSSCWP
jgi:hypothetical protein